MAIVNDNRLEISKLDFDGIKASLKTFMQSQTEFTDYDFDGSGISVLLDVLSYNTHYMSYYLNMVGNEMFMDSAINRDSVVSLAKQLGYVPTSTVAAQALISFTAAVTGGAETATIPAWTKFSVVSDRVKYIFQPVSDVIVAEKVTYTKTNSAQQFSFKTSFQDMQSIWSISFCINTYEHYFGGEGVWCGPFFQINTPDISLGEDDTWTIKWTVLREF